MASLVESASDDDIQSLDERWSPLVRGVLICGSRTTRNGNVRTDLEDELLRLIDRCQKRGISVDRGDVSLATGGRLELPLVLAAHYGLHRTVKRLLEAGAKPGLVNGGHQTALYAALQNPTSRDKLRECDRLTADLLFNSNIVTSDLRLWRTCPPGSKIYINREANTGSAIWRAINDRNVDAAILLKRHGAVITDRDYLFILRHQRKETGTFLMIDKVTAATASDNSHPRSSPRNLVVWSPELDWSFPPTWKVTVALCGSCGLPGGIFREHVIPLLPRHWFYSSAQLARPPLFARKLRASHGDVRELPGTRTYYNK